MEPIHQSKKKIGILTFHREINAGANLQAYALNSFLIKNGFDAEIIDYIPNSELDKRSLLRKSFHLIKTLLIPKAKKENKLKREFKDFQKKYYILSKTKYYGDKDFSLYMPDKYDILLSGSDQILNLTLSMNSLAYYLPVDNVKKVSYGSSFGRENISSMEKHAIKKYLSTFSYLSFRERTAFKTVVSIIKDIDCNIVLDPVFLLSSEDWAKLSVSIIKTSYVFVYCMEDTEWFKRTIQHVHELYPNYFIVVAFGSGKEFDLGFKYLKYNGISPIDFISLISNSELVITNSFHGLAFSIIFEKPFYCCAHSSRNTRLENLLSLAKEDNKIINHNTVVLSAIDGRKCLKELDNEIVTSKQYLFKSLK